MLVILLMLHNPLALALALVEASLHDQWANIFLRITALSLLRLLLHSAKLSNRSDR